MSKSMNYLTRANLNVHTTLIEFVENELLPDLGINSDDYWSGIEAIFTALGPVNQSLLEKRDSLQQQIDEWHRHQVDKPWDHRSYQKFLEKIGYLVPEGDDFNITTNNVDVEIAKIAGPQLVVPVSNARFALNAANARWGSLYDALYGSDVISEAGGQERAGAYNPSRGAAVIAYAATFLDNAVPLKDNRSHADVSMYKLFHHNDKTTLQGLFEDGAEVDLLDSKQFVGCRHDDGRLMILLRNHGLHIELIIDSGHPIGKTANAHLADVVLESALTTIQDCEDSVAAVDAADKVDVYRNWLGLMRGSLDAAFQKAGKTQQRVLAKDRTYTDATGDTMILSGRSLLLVRNVGHLMRNSAILNAHGDEIPEGIMDAVITGTCALYDVSKQDVREGFSGNSKTGSVYIVKPKMHGPDEVAFTDKLFARVEDLLGMARNTLKVGVMDEERRTTVNLKECIREVSERLVFINTGFLDRTGDEIHTSMHAGTMLPKDEIKKALWIDAYERWNVDVGIACGLPGKAQIGKGMWAKPDELGEMVATKQAHLEAGANCAWVPSPTAATLHAMHYHSIDVFAKQKKLSQREFASRQDILTPPLALEPVKGADIEFELRNSCQSILGYVVRWVDQGVGCSKVPDLDNVGLMEDRATLRISSQLLANWLVQKVCTEAQVLSAMKEMATVVDQQNQGDPSYLPMSPHFDRSVAFAAACDLVLKGAEQPNGYTEPLLHQRRIEQKARAAL